jgi:hypothetical protein
MPFVLPSSVNNAAGQQTKQKVIELKATKSTTRGEGADANIKSDKETNDPNAQFAAPTKKGGAKTRGGGYCEVRFDNRSQWFVKLYIDGTYRGTLSPYGDSVGYTMPGETTVYARADFDDGSYYYWGPKGYDCGPNQYIYFRMNP